MSAKNQRWLLAWLGVLGVLYAIITLGYVAVSPDLRIRAFFIDPPDIDPNGITIQRTLGLRIAGGDGRSAPRTGDVLLKVGVVSTPTLLDFFDANEPLYRPDESRIDKVTPSRGDPTVYDPREWSRFELNPRVRDESRGVDFVEVLFRQNPREGRGRVESAWVELQPVPPFEIALSFIWLVPHLAVLLVGAAAVWQRPFDRTARLFYVLCVVTIGAYIGGFHWWTIANSVWLTGPFLVCAILMPATTLHFFAVYPRPVAWAVTRPRSFLLILYALPAVGIAAGGLYLVYSGGRGSLFGPAADGYEAKVAALTSLRVGVNVGIGVAAGYYALTIAALVRGLLVTRDPWELAQVKWILTAALAATLPVGYSVWLAATDRAEFAFGGARLPMFFASFGFSLAYAVCMLRYRLIWADRVLTAGVRYYAARLAIALGVAGLLAALDGWSAGGEVRPAVVAVTVLSALLLLWVRDRLQRELDRRFFTEKYRLDATLRGVHSAADGQLTDDRALAGRVLASCRDVLDVGRAAVYRLADADRGGYREVAAIGGGFPEELSVAPDVIQTLSRGGYVQRVPSGGRADLSPAQALLRRLSAVLVYAPPSADGPATLMVLGPKPDAAAFTAEDLTFVGALGHVADVALGVRAVVHRALAEELRQRDETLAGQSRQIGVLRAELADFHRSQGTAVPAAEGEFRREIIRGDSPAILRVLETTRKVAGSDATVLVRGESGTGKELLAQVLHDNSPRAAGPLIRVHCAALSPTLLESELFGHMKGAFTGADRDKIGRFQMADGGTLFLDEIGEISPEVQVKLLRVLQERCFEPVGSGQTVRIDVRLVTATNRDLEAMIQDGRFREDLYYRLNVISLTLPPLRERREDVDELALTFLHRAARRLGKPVTAIEAETLAVLRRYGWPGNVRELQNVIERAVVLADGETVTLADLPAELAPLRTPTKVSLTKVAAWEPRRERAGRRTAPVARRTAAEPAESLGDAGERALLEAALRDADGNKASAARLLGLPRSTFFSKLKKHDLS